MEALKTVRYSSLADQLTPGSRISRLPLFVLAVAFSRA